MKYLNTMNARIERSEVESRTKIPRIFDAQVAFQYLLGRITLFAIDKVKYEWNAAKILYNGDSDSEVATSSCSCEIITRYALPCQHRLLPMVAENRPIPLSLLHPRWQISGPISPFDWTMKDQPPDTLLPTPDTLLSTTTILRSQQSHDIYINQGRDLLVQSLYYQEQLHGSLSGEKAELFASLHHTHATHMRNMFAESTPQLVPSTPQVQVPSTQQVVPSTPQIVASGLVIEKPIIQEFVPPALNKFQQKKSKGKAKARALTAVELAE